MAIKIKDCINANCPAWNNTFACLNTDCPLIPTDIKELIKRAKKEKEESKKGK